MVNWPREVTVDRVNMMKQRKTGQAGVEVRSATRRLRRLPTSFWSPAGRAERMGAALRGDRPQEDTMGKTGRKRRGRKKKAANHGKRPNA